MPIGAGRDVRVRARRGRRVEPGDEIRDRAVGGVVLELGQTDDVGVSAFSAATILVRCRVNSAALSAPRQSRPPVGPQTAGPVVERREVVEHVRAGDPKRATDGRRPGRPRVGAREAHRGRGLDAICPESVAEDARQTGDGVADPQRVVGADVRHDGRVLDVAVVVELDPATIVSAWSAIAAAPGATTWVGV